MADPAIVSCTKNAWTKIATSVTGGRYYVKNGNVKYVRTYNATGTGTPADSDVDKAIRVNSSDEGNEINSDSNVDVYVWVYGDENGSIITEL